MNRLMLCALLFSLFVASLDAQTKERKERIRLDGEIVTALITETDTILIADLDDVSVSSPRKFKDREEYRRYLKYRRYAAKVYPYAAKAIRIFRETEMATQEMNKRKRKRHIKRLQKEMKSEFKEPLKKLTKTQGKILIKMIEKELDTPFYTLLKNLRGGMTAAYWNQLGKLYGYQLKSGYIPGEDPLLDAVLNDMDISYDPYQ
ncbi:MAG: DUF4294 domain-containing protein [Bacteroidota bacterium]